MPEPPIDGLLRAITHIAHSLWVSSTETPNLGAALAIAVSAGLDAAEVAQDDQTVALAGDAGALSAAREGRATHHTQTLPMRHQLTLVGTLTRTGEGRLFADALCAVLGQAIVSDHRTRRAEEAYRLLIERAPYAVAVHRAWTVTHANGLWLQITRGSGPGQQLLDWVHDADRAEAMVVIERGDQSYVEVRSAGNPDQWFELSATSGLRFDDQGASMVVAREVTSRRELQQQVLVYDRMATIGLMAAGVAHEINNPLAAVVANLEMARRRLSQIAAEGHPVAPELMDVVDDSAEAASRMRDIVRDLRVFSRGPDATVEPLDVRKVMDTSVRMAGNTLRHHARVVRHYGEVPDVLGSPSRVGQVFLNLLVNAAQAMSLDDASTNQVDLHIRADGPEVVVEVQDNGPGIPEDLLPQMFRPFVTTKSRNEGTGLGLAICQRIVTDLGGRITVDSEPGLGARFTMRFPASPIAARPPPPPPADRATARRPGRVLMIDDEELVGRAVQRILRPEHEVVHFTQAPAALRRIEDDPYWDLILLDLVMPVMNGIATYEALQERAPHLVRHVVVVTGGIFTERDRRFLERTTCPTLEKPFDAEALRTLIDEMLSMSSPGHLR
ncbi:MAG: response regulator [Myxococcales bacterium]|nr:response regulator [Myxococcales bacterium]